MTDQTPEEPTRGLIVVPQGGVPSTPPEGLFQPLTEEEQEQFNRLRTACSGLVSTSQLALMRAVFEGRDRALVCEVLDLGDEVAVTPLAVLVDDDMFARLQPDANPEVHGIRTVRKDDESDE